MQVKCKICKKDLTSQAIKLLEGKITKVICRYCEYDKAIDELCTKEMSHKEFDKQLDEIAIKYGYKS